MLRKLYPYSGGNPPYVATGEGRQEAGSLYVDEDGHVLFLTAAQVREREDEQVAA